MGGLASLIGQPKFWLLDGRESDRFIRRIMRWSDRSYFLLAFFAAAIVARGGVSRIGVDTPRPPVLPTIAITMSSVHALAPLVFADSAPAQIQPADDAFIAELTEFALARPEALAHVDAPGAFHAFPIDLQTVGINQRVRPSSTPTTVAIPLPPAAIGGALIAATVLGRPLLGARRRRAARTFR